MALRPRKKTRRQTKAHRCPRCGSQVPRYARRCKRCSEANKGA